MSMWALGILPVLLSFSSCPRGNSQPELKCLCAHSASSQSAWLTCMGHDFSTLLLFGFTVTLAGHFWVERIWNMWQKEASVRDAESGSIFLTNPPSHHWTEGCGSGVEDAGLLFSLNCDMLAYNFDFSYQQRIWMPLQSPSEPTQFSCLIKFLSEIRLMRVLDWHPGRLTFPFHHPSR